jgi:hypothetical protein
MKRKNKKKPLYFPQNSRRYQHFLVCIVMCGLSTHSVSQLRNPGSVINDTGKVAAGSGRGLFQETIKKFSWRD